MVLRVAVWFCAWFVVMVCGGVLWRVVECVGGCVGYVCKCGGGAWVCGCVGVRVDVRLVVIVWIGAWWWCVMVLWVCCGCVVGVCG